MWQTRHPAPLNIPLSYIYNMFTVYPQFFYVFAKEIVYDNAIKPNMT